MTIGIAGNYTLRMKFGENNIPLVPSGINEITIIQDINRFLPSLYINMADPSGILTHIQPFDKEMSRISMEIGSLDADAVTNTFSFLIFRRYPDAVNMTGMIYEINALLNVPNLFNPSHTRASKGLVSTILSSIALDELIADEVDISPSLQVEKTIIQAQWSNSDLFRYLKKMLGDELGYAYKPFMYVYDNKFIFSFRSLEDMSQSDPTYKFIINDEPFQDYRPVSDYRIYDNYNVLGIKGVKQQNYGYFDYEAGQWVAAQDDYRDFFSLSDYIATDIQDPGQGQPIFDTGRTNEFSWNFLGRVRSEFYTRINDLTKMWITTWGLPNAVPGEVVKVLFAQGILTGNLATYQYSGYWMVERVVHTFGNSFMTKLLLTRAGIDTDQKTSLTPAIRGKR